MDEVVAQGGPNVLGAVLFFAYIAAALVLTTVVVKDLLCLYLRSYDVRKMVVGRPNRSTREVARRRDVARWFVALSGLSFAVLSFNMLPYLVQSFKLWHARGLSSGHAGSRISGALPGHWQVESSIDLYRAFVTRSWSWATNSTPFKDLATVLVDDPKRFWWTQQALLYSIGWNTFMTVQAATHAVPHCRAYVLLTQILPISFTQNLFCAAVLLHPARPQTGGWTTPSRSLQVVTIVAFVTCLVVAPSSVGSPWFVTTVLATRVMLIAPCVILRSVPTRQPTFSPVTRSTGRLHVQHVWLYGALSLVAILLHLRQTWLAWPIVETVGAVTDDPAVAAVGFDYLLAITSVGFLWTTGASLDLFG